jgi:ketosteroid isomerase-like protein
VKDAAKVAVEAVDVFPDKAVEPLEKALRYIVVVEDGDIAIATKELEIGAEPDPPSVVVALQRSWSR